MFLSTKLEESAVGSETFLLCGYVGVGDGALPEAGVLEEWPETGIVLVGAGGELFGALFVCFFSDFPNLGSRYASGG